MIPSGPAAAVMAKAAEVLPPSPRTIPVDFCRGFAGAFLAINNVVVDGTPPGDGSGRVIISFEISPAALLRALSVKSVAQPEQPIAPDRRQS